MSKLIQHHLLRRLFFSHWMAFSGFLKTQDLTKICHDIRPTCSWLSLTDCRLGRQFSSPVSGGSSLGSASLVFRPLPQSLWWATPCPDARLVASTSYLFFSSVTDDLLHWSGESLSVLFADPALDVFSDANGNFGTSEYYTIRLQWVGGCQQLSHSF